MNVLPTQRKLQVISSLIEGNSVRSTERMTGVHRDTICRLLVEVGQNCAALLDSQLQGLTCHKVQCDEIWCFVGKKNRHVREGDSPDMGDQWVFVAMDAETKLVPAHVVGKRTALTTLLLVSDLAQRIRNRPQITTDGFRFYVNAIEESFGSEVDFAQLVKLYGDYGQHDAGPARYSPPPIMETITRIIQGTPDEGHISTSYVERQNLTMRMQMRRFTRLTNAFSKKLENLKAACALHFAHYNFCRIHSTLRVTPAMAAGVTSEIWPLSSLLLPAQIS
jgi:IS1 family transposase